MLRQVLIAYDGTPSSESALRLGFEVARSMRLPLQVVTVVGGTAAAKGAEFEADRRAAWKDLRNLEREATREGLSILIDVLVGEAADEILKRATDADLLVLGRSQQTAVERLAFASVADLVLAEAPCAVLLPKVDKP